MNKLITTLLGLVILAVLVICVMNMLGLGDMVSDAGNTLRNRDRSKRRVKEGPAPDVLQALRKINARNLCKAESQFTDAAKALWERDLC